MYKTARNWDSIADLIQDMRTHIYQAGIRRHRFSDSENLLSNEGIPIKEYSLVIKELFCIASADLASDLRQPLEAMGILYDEIVNTDRLPKKVQQDFDCRPKFSGSMVDLENDISLRRVSGKGQILFLVNIMERYDRENLKAVGYRFASLNSVSQFLATSLQIRHKTLLYHIKMMQNYIKTSFVLDQGIYFALFAIRASVNASHNRFEILARKDAKTQLPSMQINIEDINEWNFAYLKKMQDMSMRECIEYLFQMAKSSKSSETERNLAKTFLTSLEALRSELNNPVFEKSQLLAMPFEIPCYRRENSLSLDKATIIPFKMFVPIYENAPVNKLLYVPLNFFMMAQHICRNPNDHGIHIKKTSKVMNPVLDADPGFFENQDRPQLYDRLRDNFWHKHKFGNPRTKNDVFESQSKSPNLSMSYYRIIKDKTWGLVDQKGVIKPQEKVSRCSKIQDKRKANEIAIIKHTEQAVSKFFGHSTDNNVARPDLDQMIGITHIRKEHTKMNLI